MPDYAYINTRIRSMEADLLTAGQLRELLSFRELSDAITYLKKSAYGRYLPDEPKDEIDKATVYKIDTALRTSLSDSMRKIIKMSKGDGGELIELLLGRWDVFNIKTLLRGKLNNIHAHEVLIATVPAGSLHEGILQEVYKQPSVQTMLSMLFTIGLSYVAPLLKLKYLHEGDLFRGEIELEKTFFAYAFRKLKEARKKELNIRMVEDTIRMLIDRYNFVAAVKMAVAGIQTDEAETYYINGGSMISLSDYKKIINVRDINERISMIDKLTWKEHWERFSAHARITNAALLVERWMDYEMLMYTVKLPREDPLNIGLIISYIWRKVNEIINLRTILRGIQYNIPQSDIEGLILVGGDYCPGLP